MNNQRYVAYVDAGVNKKTKEFVYSYVIENKTKKERFEFYGQFPISIKEDSVAAEYFAMLSLLAYVIKQNIQHIKIRCDCEAVVNSFRKVFNKSGKNFIFQRYMYHFLEFHHRKDLLGKVTWIPSSQNQADALCKREVSRQTMDAEILREYNDFKWVLKNEEERKKHEKYEQIQKQKAARKKSKQQRKKARALKLQQENMKKPIEKKLQPNLKQTNKQVKNLSHLTEKENKKRLKTIEKHRQLREVNEKKMQFKQEIYYLPFVNLSIHQELLEKYARSAFQQKEFSVSLIEKYLIRQLWASEKHPQGTQTLYVYGRMHITVEDSVIVDLKTKKTTYSENFVRNKKKLKEATEFLQIS